MEYKINNTLIPSSWFEKTIFDTLKLYEKGKDLSNSPIIQFQRNWRTTGGMHLDCWKADDYEKCIHERQDKLIALYKNIKNNGYKDEKPICVTFDEDGYIHLYDGHHRLSVLRYLKMEVGVTILTDWQGAVDRERGRDFPLIETIEKTHKGRRFLYQWVPDKRIKDFPCSRPDSKPRLEYILKHLKGKTVLDIGCSEGYFSTELAKRGFKVTGVDINRNLIATARYLSIIQNAKVNYQVADFRDILREKGRFDNILYLSVLHNNVNTSGERQAFEDLKLFRGKTDRMIIEIPDVVVQPDWAYLFREDIFNQRLEVLTKMNIQDAWKGYRPIFLLDKRDKKATLNLPANDYVAREIKKSGVWEKKTTEFIKKHLKKGQTFLDVGAQAGYFTILASKLGANVQSFEPSKESYAILKKNTKKCQNVKLFKKALSDKKGRAKLFKAATLGQYSLVRKQPTYEKVDMVCYDSLSLGVPDMIKIDVEGAEKLVLDGMPKVLKTKKPIYLIIEDWYNHLTDWLIDKHGFELVATERAYGNRILAKNKKITFVQEPIRIHLLGPFNTPTTLGDEGIGNAFSSKVVRMAKVLKRLGHYVIFYGVEGSEVECDEYVQVSTRAILEKTYGKWEKNKVYGCTYGDFAHTTFNENAIKEINKRRLFGDFLLCCFGNYQKQIADAVRIPDTVEIGIGYTGSFAKFRIFESQFQMNYTYGAEKAKDGDFYDCVIPGFFDPVDFEYVEKKDDYYLYLGRVVKRKGIAIAQQVCEKIGAKLIVAGFASRDNKWDIQAFQDLLKSPKVKYVGFAGLKKRNKLMSKAKAVFMPTIYLEPFGYVALEANFCGTPVITTDFGAFPETIQNGVNGYRCRTFAEFVEATKNVGKIKPKDCRKWAIDNYSLDTVTPMYKRYFDQILNLYGKGWYKV